MSALLYLFLILSPYLVLSYNIDTSYPIVYEDPEPTEPGNYFGYSVALSFRRNSVPAWSLFVGAPRYSNGTGKAYRCNSGNGTNIGATAPCRGLSISSASAPEVVTISGHSYIDLHTGKTGWLGASMATGESSNLTVCAPRSLITAKNPKNPTEVFIDDMSGYCFDVLDASQDVMYRDNHILATEVRYPVSKLINTMYGFSVDYAVKKGDFSTVNRIIGQPRLDKVEIKRGQEFRHLHELHLDELSNLGYSVTSGYYFDSTELVFLAGAPGWSRTGKVTVIETSYSIEKCIHGTLLGEYFGASLATGDFDGDGFDDLAVGAPHWGEVDFGRVYTYYGNTVRTFDRGLTLDGTVEYGQFGYTLASADLDNDKYSDLIVSAPWEESGVVYIFYGSPSFRMRDSSAGITQRIEPSMTTGLRQVRGFGFALSRGVDIDDNGYPDLAIGAYKSGHAVILRGRPVIKTKIQLEPHPRRLLPAPGQSFVVALCVEYSGEKAPETQDLQFQMTVDEVHKRIEGGSLRSFTVSCKRDTSCCRNETIKLADEIANVVDEIPVRVKHSIMDKVVDGDRFCPTCPVASKKDIKEVEETTVYFNTGCRSSTSGTICNAHLSVEASFGGTRADNEWVVGSGDISLDLVVSNTGDPAYQTQLTINLPAKIGLRNVISTCIPDTSENAITLVCQVGNPIGKGETKNLRIDLDMGSIIESSGLTNLSFTIKRLTRSEDHGTDKNPITLDLIIKNRAWITLTGLADQESHDYSLAENKSTVPIRHSYHIFKVGETPISKAELIIDVPVAIDGKNYTFLNITDPRFTGSTGVIYTCSIHGDAALLGLVPTLIPNNNFQQRRRREISDTTVASVTTDEPNDNNESRNDKNEKGVTVSSLATERIIYLNCTTIKDVVCVEIKCLFKLPKNSNDSANLALDVVFNASAFYESKEDSLTVKFNTNARVRIIVPDTLDPTFIERSNTTAEVSTMLYNIPEPQKLAGWVYPCSIIFGILLFCLLAFILFRVGFFNRPKKAETAKAKERDMILKVGGNGDGDDENYG